MTASGTPEVHYQWFHYTKALAGETNSSLMLEDLQPRQAGVYSVIVSNACGSVTSSDALLTVLPPTEVDWLVNVDFVPWLSGTPKIGPAAIGQGSNDFWNFYTRDDGNGGWLTFGSTTNLSQADGTPTSVGLTVANAPGAWRSSSTDPMYETYLYPFSGNATITITNLPAGAYDFYVYSYDGNYELLVDGISQGVETCYESPIVNPPVWQEGVQYVLFAQVSVGEGNDVELIVREGLDNFAIISGLQIRNSIPAPPQPPFIVSQPESQTVTEGGSAEFTVSAGGSAPLFYQWYYVFSPLEGETNSSLILNNVTAEQAGDYAVEIANAVGSVGSAYATLTVDPAPSVHWLVNVDFRAGPVDGMSAKVGPAAIGLGTNDFWNYYTRDDGAGGWLTFGTLADLVSADGNPTTVGMTVANAPGKWQSASSDEMYRHYIYPFSGNATITITNLPTGAYDFYVYSYDGNYELLVDGVSQGVETCYESPIVNPPAWQEGVHYVRFEQIDVTTGENVEVIVRDGLGNFAIISGIQINGVFASPSVVADPNLTLKAWTSGQTPGLHLIFAGTTTESYDVEASEDMVNWENIGTATHTGAGQFQFSDPAPMNQPCRFYRVVPTTPATE